MKKKLFSIGMIIVLVLSSMLLSATPAAAGDLAWTSVGVPNPPLSNQVTANTSVSKITVAPNGDIFAIDSIHPNTIYKSVSGGYSWKATAVAGAPTFVDIAISPSYATDSTVFALAAGPAAQAYISSNGGTSFAVLGGTAAGTGVAIAVAPNYAAGNGEVMVGTNANVYIWGKNGVLNWTIAGTTAKAALDVAFSPNYPIDGTRVVATSSNISTLVGSDADWDDTLVWGTPITLAGASADMEFPADFNASLPVARTIYVADVGVGVYRASVGSSTAATSIGMTAPNVPQDIVYNGTGLSGTLYAGTLNSANVWRSDNPAAVPATNVVFTPNFGAPTGTGATYVALPKDFATSNKVYAGTASAIYGNSAFSISSDRGAYFHQTGLIDTILASMNDMKYASASEIFVFTNDAAGGADSLWKSANGGLTWDRIYSFVATNNTALVELSPDYATDHTLFIGDIGKTAANALLMSNDGGSTFVGRAVPVITVGAIAAKDMYTILVGSGNSGAVQMTANGGWTWQPAATVAVTGATAITDIDVDAGSGAILVGANTGAVAISTNSNTSYSAVGAPLGGGNAIVAFDANYGSNNIVYGATTSTAAVFNVARCSVGPGTAWVTMTPAGAAGVRDMATAPDGTLYVTSNASTGVLYRSINPTAGPPTLSTAEWSSTSPAPATQLGKFNLMEGSNIVSAINPAIATGSIVTYTDTLTTAIPTQKTPAAEEVLTSTTAFFSWDAIPGATKYTVQYDIRADWANNWTTSTTNVMDTSVVVTSLTPGASYYWRVRVETPMLSPWSQTRTFVSQLGTGGPTAPTLVPTGPTAPGGTNAPLLPAFQWVAVKGATGYQFQLATDAGMVNMLVDEILAGVNVYTVTSPLDYSTTYYWRVKALSAASSTDWSSIAAFMTMAEPTGPATTAPPTVVVPTQEPPVINIPTQPAPVITVEAPDVADDGAPAGYIWAVIIIGAVLVIALIVLIVRTRRTV